MIEATSAFRSAIVGKTRRIYLKAVVDISDPDMTIGAVTSSGLAPWSKSAQLTDKDISAPPRCATLEKNRWLLDGSFAIFPDDYQIAGEIGTASEELSGADGAFSSPAWTQLSFANVSVLQACSIFFSSDPLDGVPEDFTVDILVDGVSYHTETYTGNTQSAVKISGFTVYTPDAIKITVTKWSLPHRRMRTVEIIPGYYEQWSEDMLASFSVQQQGDVSCLTLPYGMLKMAMNNKSRIFEPRSKSGLFQSIEERQGVEAYIGVRLADGTVEYKRVGVFYQYSDGWKTGDNGLTMQWDLVDIIGLLADRAYLAPTVLPITLSGWIASLVSQLGTNFTDRYTVDADYADLAVTASSRAAVSGKKCGDILRWACMATGTWPRADAESGKLAVEPLWNQGSKITLENLVNYPTMKANQSLASLIFHLSDGTEYVVSGNSTSSEKTVTIENPFLHTQAQALTAARLILSCYGGNQLELTGRGDPASEIGDVDTVWLNESRATAARRIYQTFQFADGVLQGCQSKLLQADGSYLYDAFEIIRESGTWTAPPGVTHLRLVLGQGGQGGGYGGDGYVAGSGAIPGSGVAAGYGNPGTDGLGGKVWFDTVTINAGQTFNVSLGAGGAAAATHGAEGAEGGETTFGVYTSANGQRYPNGYTDIANGQVFARTGVAVPESGTGDGGKGGDGGDPGQGYWKELFWTPDVPGYNDNNAGKPRGWDFVVTKEPGKGKPGKAGASGFVMVTWDRSEETA